jgi:hypothetical protein
VDGRYYALCREKRQKPSGDGAELPNPAPVKRRDPSHALLRFDFDIHGDAIIS